MPSPTTDKLAVLIDADNAQSSIIGDVLTEVARYGTATIKRAYGDWTTPNLNGGEKLFIVSRSSQSSSSGTRSERTRLTPP